MRVVLADDEAVILKGLQKLIDWEDLGMDIIDAASDGEMLEEIIREKQPDLVISDIMMPKQTGLEVIEHCYNDGLKTRFIFISGFQEFSYAQQAMKFGAAAYLLKPVRAEELKEACLIVKKELDEQGGQAARPQEISRKDALQSLKDNITEDAAEELTTFLEQYKKQPGPEKKWFTAVCIGVRSENAQTLMEQNYELFSLMRLAMFGHIADYFAENKKGIIAKRDDTTIGVLLILNEDEKETWFEQIVDPICCAQEEQFNLQLCIGAGVMTDDVNQLNNAHKSAKYAFDLQFFETNRLIEFEKLEISYDDLEKEYNKATEQVFRAIISKEEDLHDKVAAVLDLIRQMHYGAPSAVRSRVMIFTGDIGSRLRDLHFLTIPFSEMQDKLMDEIQKAPTCLRLRECVYDYFRALRGYAQESGRSRERFLIAEVKNYIRDHYAEEFSIKKLADLACVSQNYFSAMFKKETGQNYKAYLTEVRMEAALKLLQETDDKTYEIGEKVGYNDSRRFVEAFRQIYNMTPAEYRKSLKQ